MILSRRVQSVGEAGAGAQGRKLILSLIGLVLLMATAVLPVLAHGGGLIYVAGEPAGDYRVTVWVAPNEVEAGKTLHFTVAVVAAENNDMILDADVTVDVFDTQSGELLLSAPATTAQSVNKLFYEADFPQAPGAGMYTAVTTVNGRYGSGDVSFNFEIIPVKTRINWLLVGIVGLLVIVVIGFFLSRRTESKPEEN
ncbi:MAG: hypothetical protein IAF02_15295 [Anaerolineae bacterium]|nr:hypothetical protein [Anaerolineae bacterium]